MKVVLLTTYQSGGAGTAAFRLHEGLLAEGINSIILCTYSVMERTDIVIATKRTLSVRSRIAAKIKIRTSTRRDTELRKVNDAKGTFDYFSLPYLSMIWKIILLFKMLILLIFIGLRIL